MKPLLAAAVVGALASGPALAQQSYPYPPAPADQGYAPGGIDQQAQMPREDGRERGKVDQLRTDKMSSPNIRGERVPENPSTGLPEPGVDTRELTLPPNQ
ncbi:MAG: hypothetical protein HY985_00305 [Magnetospirillum sp.]|nr:hypothetical protein [Magnetospirillum sp.]